MTALPDLPADALASAPFDAPRRLPWLLTIAVGVAASVAGFGILSHREDLRHRAEFGHVAADRERLLRDELRIDQALLGTVQGFRDGSERVERPALATFLERLRATRRDLALLAWAPRVPGARLEATVAALRAEGSEAFRVRRREAGGGWVPSPPREEYVPITVATPASEDASVLGWDLAAEPGILPVLEAARDLAEVRVTPVVHLSSRDGARRPEGVVFLVQPVYARAAPRDDLAQRRGALEGYAVAVLDPRSRLKEALGALAPGGLDVFLTDRSPGVAEPALGFLGVHAGRPATEGVPNEVTVVDGELAERFELPVGGRTWEVLCVSAPAFHAARRPWLPFTVLAAGLLLTAATAHALRSSLNREAAVRRAVAERTTELSRANEQLRREVAVRRATEASLAEQTDRLDVTLRGLSDGVVTTDALGRVTYMNPAAQALTGWDRETARGCPFREVIRFLDEATRAARPDLLDAVLDPRSGPGFPESAILVAVDGTERTVSPRSAPLKDRQGRPGGVVVLLRDVTESRRAEEERRGLETRMQHAQRLESLGVLAGGIAHDFNNLLMGILGNADLALMHLEEGSPARGRVEDVKRAGLRASELTQQMLAYAGKGRFVVEVVDLNDLVRDMSKLLEVSVSRRVSLEMRFQPDLPPVEVDPSQLRQVVMNLITNAAEAIGDEPGTVTVTTRVADLDEAWLLAAYGRAGLAPGRCVLLEVTDTGVGMDASTQRKIFEPFFTTKFTGRGLGLAALLGIVRGHRGAVRVESAPGRGTTFTVALPPSATPLPARHGVAPVAPTHAGGTVLVVDDDATVREVVSRMLAAAGFTVLSAADGREGVEAFRTSPAKVDAVLLDMTMPGMSGEEVLREIRALRPDARVLIMSGFTEQDATARFRGLGLSGFIQKPFERKALVECVRDVVRPRA